MIKKICGVSLISVLLYSSSFGLGAVRLHSVDDDGDEQENEIVEEGFTLVPRRNALFRLDELKTSEERRIFLADTVQAGEAGKWVIAEYEKHWGDPKFTKAQLEKYAGDIVDALLNKKLEKKQRQAQCIASYQVFKEDFERIQGELKFLSNEIERFVIINRSEKSCLTDIDQKIMIQEKDRADIKFVQSQTPIEPIKDESLNSLHERKILSQQLQTTLETRIEICKKQINEKKEMLDKVRKAIEQEKHADELCAQALSDINFTLIWLGKTIEHVADPSTLSQSCNDLNKITKKYKFEDDPDFAEKDALIQERSNCTIV